MSKDNKKQAEKNQENSNTQDHAHSYQTQNPFSNWYNNQNWMNHGHKDFENKFYENMKNSTHQVNEAMESISKNAENMMTCTNILNEATNTIAKQVGGYVNTVYKDSVSLFNEALGCSSPEEVLAISEKVYNLYTNAYMSNCMDITNIWLNCANEMSRPVQKMASEQFTKMNNKFNK